jgi:DNA polymerase IV
VLLKDLVIVRSILHVDMNNFYASVECLYRPEIRSHPVAVAGNPLNRHGIILAKNGTAKKLGVTTGEAIWEARTKAPDLILVPPNYGRYLKFSRLARQILYDYTDQVEAFGLDENWADVTGSLSLFGSAEAIAETIRQRVKTELGVTVSIGVSFNKIFAKLGSDLKKPDAITCIPADRYRDIVWPLPVADLLYVGHRTAPKLNRLGILTIGDLARTDCTLLRSVLGKWGEVLWCFANGLDTDPVRTIDESSAIQSIGNGTTTPRDLITEQDVRLVHTVLAESVAARLRDCALKATGVQIQVRDAQLLTYSRQCKLPKPTNLSDDLLRAAMELFREMYDWHRPIRGLSLRAIRLVTARGAVPLSLFENPERELRREQLARSVDDLRRRFGFRCIRRMSCLLDEGLTSFNPKEDHTIHPIGFFR